MSNTPPSCGVALSPNHGGDAPHHFEQFGYIMRWCRELETANVVSRSMAGS